MTGKRQSCLNPQPICWADLSMIPFAVIEHKNKQTKTQFAVMRTTQRVCVSYYPWAQDNASTVLFSYPHVIIH